MEKKKKTLEELARELINPLRYGHVGDAALADTVEFEAIPPPGGPPPLPPNVPPTLSLRSPPEQGWNYDPEDVAPTLNHLAPVELPDSAPVIHFPKAPRFDIPPDEAA